MHLPEFANSKERLRMYSARSFLVPRLLLIAVLLFGQRGDFFECPDVIRNACFDSGSHTQRLVDAPEIVVHVLDCQRVFVISAL